MPATQQKLEPFLKWPGGKRALLPLIERHIPVSFSKYFEPFLGGGALFFNLCPESAILSDHNEDLIECYTEIRDHVSEVIDYLALMPNTEEDYYKTRVMKPSSPQERAARFIYLTKLSFNGIYRVNLRGEFNVPYGKKMRMNPCEKEALFSASTALKSAKLSSGDFQTALESASWGDLVYLDPPYTVAHSNNGFVKYNAKIFSWADQVRLAKQAHILAEKGCCVIVSNAYHSSIIELYKDFDMYILTRHSRIAASKDYRGIVSEALFVKGLAND